MKVFTNIVLCICILMIFGSVDLFAEDPPTFYLKWGSLGSGDGQFNELNGVAADSSDNIYVADRYNYRIQKFTSEGVYLTEWGSYGSGDSQYKLPNGIGVDSSDNIYVVDSYNKNVQKFTSEGVFLTKWGSEGSGDGQFDYAMFI